MEARKQPDNENTGAKDPDGKTPIYWAGQPLQTWFSLFSRLVLGIVWLVAGGLKLVNLGESVLAVRAYQILPFELTTIVGYALPIGEVILGIMLIIGVFPRFCGWVSAGLMGVFILAIASIWIRGISIDCGCFGGGGAVANAFSSYPWEIARDALLGGIGIWLGLLPKTVFEWHGKLSEKPLDRE